MCKSVEDYGSLVVFRLIGFVLVQIIDLYIYRQRHGQAATPFLSLKARAASVQHVAPLRLLGTFSCKPTSVLLINDNVHFAQNDPFCQTRSHT